MDSINFSEEQYKSAVYYVNLAKRIIEKLNREDKPVHVMEKRSTALTYLNEAELCLKYKGGR